MILHPRGVITTLLLSLALLASTDLQAVETVAVQLEGISDGDTLYVRDTNKRASYRVRMAVIDAPEKTQAYGVQAKAALAQLLRGAGPITLHIYGQDGYGRLIAMVEDERGRNINLQMVAQGAAWVYEKYARRPEYSSLYGTLITAEQNARMRQLGLWNDPAPVEPWRFRRSN